MRALGVNFVSETDTETLVQLIQMQFDAHPLSQYGCGNGTVLNAVENALQRIDGSYAIAVVSGPVSPESIVFARNGSELVVGFSRQDEAFVSSDIEALRGYADRYIRISDGEIGMIGRAGYFLIRNVSQQEIATRIQTI